MKSLNEIIKKHGLEKGCNRYIKNYYKRKNTLNKRVETIINNYNYVYFCTYTISEEYIQSNIDFIRVLKKVLNEHNYILNADFGGKNGRLHYHALVGFNENIKYKELMWKYGSCNFKKVFNNNIKAIANYINKLSNHTRQNKVIYSRKYKKNKKELKK